ncbi:MAG: DUF6350 family protein [Actinomycetes bacterium]
MTELLSRPTRLRPAPQPTRPATTTTLTAVAAGVIAAGAGLLVIAVVVITTWASSLGGGAGAADALRAVAYVWLVSHRVSLSITTGGASGHVALLPMGLLALPAYALWRAGRWFAHACEVEDVRGTLTGGLVLGGAYGFIAAVVASASLTSSVRPAAGQALTAGCIVGMLFGTAGVAHGAGIVSPFWQRIPDRVRSAARSAIVGVAVLFAAGGALALGPVTLHLGRVLHLASALHPGPVGDVALVLACLAYLPNAVLWCVSYTLGPGFAVGAQTSVSPLGVHLGAVPSFPLLGALPGSGAAPLLSLPFVLAPLIAGAVMGRAVVRRNPMSGLTAALLTGFATGACTGVVLGLAAALSGGPAGPGRMATVGPSMWQVTVAAAVELGVAAAAAAALTHRRMAAD